VVPRWMLHWGTRVTPAILKDGIGLIVEVERVFWSLNCIMIERGGELKLMGNSEVTYTSHKLTCEGMLKVDLCYEMVEGLIVE
jgi:hypothetical protein